MAHKHKEYSPKEIREFLKKGFFPGDLFDGGLVLVGEIERLERENARLECVLRHIKDQDYDAGYSAEEVAEWALKDSTFTADIEDEQE